MPLWRQSAPQDADDNKGDLTSFLTSLTGMVTKKKKENENKKYLDAIKGELAAGKMTQEYDVDADGNVKRSYKSKDPLKNALDQSTIDKNTAQAERFRTGGGGGLTAAQQASEGRREAAKKALLTMIQSAANKDPATAERQFSGGSGDPQMMDLLTKHGVTFQDAVGGLDAKSPYAVRQRAVAELTKAGYPVTDKNIKAAIEQLQTGE